MSTAARQTKALFPVLVVQEGGAVAHRRRLRRCSLLRVPADGCLGDVEDVRATIGWGEGVQHRLYWGNVPARAKHQMLRFP